MQSFSYIKAQNLADACEALNQAGAVPIAGGTDLMPRLLNETIVPKVLVDISEIESLKNIEVSPEKIRLGTGTKLADLLEQELLVKSCPELVKAIKRVASPQIRNIATLGGNICQYTRCQYFNQSFSWREDIGLCYRAGGEVCHQRKNSQVCVASYYSDIAPMLVAVNARALISGVDGDRTLLLSELYGSDGGLLLKQGEILTAIEFDRKKNQGWSFLARNLRRSIDFGIGIAAVVIDVGPENKRCNEASIVLGAVAPYPFKAKKAEALLINKILNEEIINEAAELAVEGINPVPEHFASPKYKKQLSQVLVRRAIKEAYGEALNSSARN